MQNFRTNINEKFIGLLRVQTKARRSSPNYLKRATYYHEILEKGYVQSQTALAKQVRVSRTKTHLILQLLKLDEQIKDCGMGGPVPNFSGRIQKHIPQPLSFSSVCNPLDQNLSRAIRATGICNALKPRLKGSIKRRT